MVDSVVKLIMIGVVNVVNFMGDYPTTSERLGVKVNVLFRKSLLLSTLRKCSDFCIENTGFLIFLPESQNERGIIYYVLIPTNPITSTSKLVCVVRGSEGD